MVLGSETLLSKFRISKGLYTFLGIFAKKAKNPSDLSAPLGFSVFGQKIEKAA
jgi:hypothetical protein